MGGYLQETISELAVFALDRLRREGCNQGRAGWRSDIGTAHGRCSIHLKGPAIPDTVPERVADAERVANTVDFRGQYTLTIDVPRRVLEISWSEDDAVRILAFSRGEWERALTALAGPRGGPRPPRPRNATRVGTSWMRMQGVRDALLNRVLTDHGLSAVPLSEARSGETLAQFMRPRELREQRDGPVTAAASRAAPSEHRQMILAKAEALGVTRTGMTELRPEFVQIGKPLTHRWVIGLVLAENYADALRGAGAVELGAHDAYRRCAESATELARYIREELGYPALAHHNGGCDIQALPMLFHAGIGELGRHGSLIHPDLGAFWRPGFVTTDLPLVADEPLTFGVQDYCMKCRLCAAACPGDAIAPAQDYIVTDGIRRWLIDNEKCFPYSRLQQEYCHICVDVCPYIHKENGDPEAKRLYKEYVSLRKKAGFDAPKSAQVASPADDA